MMMFLAAPQPAARRRRCAWLFVLGLFCLWSRIGGAPSAGAGRSALAEKAGRREAVRIQNLILLRLANGIPLPDGGRLEGRSIGVQVKTLPLNRYAVLLVGHVGTLAQKDAVVRFVEGLKLPGVEDTDIDATGIHVGAPEPAPVAQQVINRYRVGLRELAAPVTFAVLPLTRGEYAVVLSGTFDDDTKLALAHSRAASVRLPGRNWHLVDQLQPKVKQPDTTLADLETRVSNFVEDPRLPKITVKAESLPGERFAVHLGSLGKLSQADADKVIAAAKLVQPDKVTVVSHLKVYEPLARVHTLRFLRGTLPDTVGRSAGAATADISGIGVDNAAVNTASFLTSVYPGTSVTAHENHLVIKGDPAEVQRIRQLLTLYLDVPSPLVRADVFTIQVNSRSSGGSRDRALDKIDEIRAGIQIVRDFMQGSQLALGQYLARHQSDVDRFFRQYPKLKDLLEQAGFETNVQRPLSTSEILIFMGLADREARERLRNDLTPDRRQHAVLAQELRSDLQRTRDLLQSGKDDSRPRDSYVGLNWKFTSDPSVARHRKQLIHLVDMILHRIDVSSLQDPPRPLMDRFVGLYDPNEIEIESDVEAFTRFLTAWQSSAAAFLHGRDDPDSDDTDKLPGQLAIATAATDLLLKQAMDALTADLQELYLQPLLEWIREDVQQRDTVASGVDLVGTTSLIVRDRTLAETAGVAEAFAKFTPIPKLQETILTEAQTLAGGTGEQTGQTVARDRAGKTVLDSNKVPVVLSNGQALAFDTDGKVVTKPSGDPVILSVAKTTNPLTALGALTPLEALGIKALFASDAAPVYHSVAPGTSLAIRPFVLPDGGSARVQLNLVTTIEAQQPDASQAAQQGRPVDRVKSQSVVTEASISAFDLVEVSSFGAQTTVPGDYAWRIPILSSLPVVGDLFHGPQGRETRRQDSIAIINLTILPRSRDLVPFFNGVVPGGAGGNGAMALPVGKP
jgi:hypothetical protein